MPDVRSLIESAQTKGLRLFLADGKVKVQATQSLDENAKALIEELREHKEEVKTTLEVEDNLVPLRAWVVNEVRGGNGQLRAVQICSDIVEAHLWMIVDRSFQPKDNLAVYYAEEIPLLRDRTPEEIREIHKVKLAFPGCRVFQEGAEKRNTRNGEGRD